MQPDDHVCLCFRVSQRKLVTFIRREQPRVVSQLSECLGAGTGCHWCVPFLEELYGQWQRGEEPGLPFAPEEYAHARRTFRKTGARPDVEPVGRDADDTRFADAESDAESEADPDGDGTSPGTLNPSDDAG